MSWIAGRHRKAGKRYSHHAGLPDKDSDVVEIGAVAGQAARLQFSKRRGRLGNFFILLRDHENGIDLLLDIQKNDPSRMPDYILLDINMPIMNGWEFLDEYTRLNIDPLNKCKVYIISSSVFSNDINKARSYPIVKDFISKPLNVEKIRELFEVPKLA